MMDTKRYKVLWLDDEYNREELDHIPRKAKKAGIDLIGFSSATEGVEELERRHAQYDAVILDGLFFEEEGSSGDAVDEAALIAVKNALVALTARTGEVLPEFVLSGQPSILSESNSVLRVHKVPRVYDKNNDADFDALWADIKTAADNCLDTQIRHRYQRVFDVCTERYIGATAASELLSILRRENDEGFVQDASTQINAIRKIVEDLFRACHREGLVPDAFVQGSLKLNETCRFLGGMPQLGFQVRNGIVPRTVADLLDSTLTIAQPASHRLHVDEHVRLVHSPYLLYATVYMLLDVLLWFKIFVDERAQLEDDAPLFEAVLAGTVGASLYTGALERDGYGNYHCGEYSITPNQIMDRYVIGDMLAISIANENTSMRNRHLYPKFATRFNKA